MLGDALTSARTGSFRGVNDHNFVIDRKWADILFRGFIEDYYFNKTLASIPWGKKPIDKYHKNYKLIASQIAPRKRYRSQTSWGFLTLLLRGAISEVSWGQLTGLSF